MGVALYRKYRSKSLDEVLGQEHITRTLLNSIKENKTSHAYLFTGPRGVGKTSVARILAHLINELDYQGESTHLDIIEIDAASNRRIDEMRELRDRVHTAPAHAKYKVYIIDEVHMLTREAFNALLKTLEEPPAHVVFILATTEAHKLPETIISRTQRFNFKPISQEQAVRHLRKIAESEAIDIDDESLAIIAEHGDGSFRDSISLLDQVRGLKNTISAPDVQEMLGVPPIKLSESLYDSIKRGNKQESLAKLEELREQGYLAHQIAKQLTHLVKNELISGTSPLAAETCSKLLRELLDVPVSHDPNAVLEIVLLTVPIGLTMSENKYTFRIDNKADPKLKGNKEKEGTASSSRSATKETKKATKPAVRPKLNDAIWQEALLALREKHNTLYTIARMATPEFAQDGLVLVFDFPFHQKRMSEAKNKKILSETISSYVEGPINISFEINVSSKASPVKSKANSSPQTTNTLDTISNIFGGGEVLES